MNQILEYIKYKEDEKDNKNELFEKYDLKYDLIALLVQKANMDPFKNLTVTQVAKDLEFGANKANEIFQRDDFPSVNIGKRKKVNILAYWLWKMERRTEDGTTTDE